MFNDATKEHTMLDVQQHSPAETLESCLTILEHYASTPAECVRRLQQLMPQMIAAKAAAQGAPAPTDKWVRANGAAASYCEQQFQRGGPRVYLKENGRDEYRPISISARRALEFASAGDVVFARMKIGGRYVWQQRVAA